MIRLVEDPQDIMTVIFTFSYTGTDGLRIEIGDKFEEEYSGVVSYSREQERRAEKDYNDAKKYNWSAPWMYPKKPYYVDIIQDLMKQYDISPSNVVITSEGATNPSTDNVVRRREKEIRSVIGDN